LIKALKANLDTLQTHLEKVQPIESNKSEDVLSSDDEVESNKLLQEALKLGMPDKK